MSSSLRTIKKAFPESILNFFRPVYHFFLAWLSSIWYRQPSEDITVIGVTGTKGKSTTTELLAHILETAGYTVAVSNTIRFQVGNENRRNKRKMSMPGRFFLQHFFRQAVNAGCDYAVIEMTSEGSKQFRHRFIQLDTLVFTNLSPEHLDAHGSFAAYKEAKLDIARQLTRSRKSPTRLVINGDDEHSDAFLDIVTDEYITFQLEDAKPFVSTASGSEITLGENKLETQLFGTFNIYNILSAAKTCHAHSIDTESIRDGIKSFSGVPGRLEAIDEGQNFGVYVDYAHTPDSLKKVYKTFEEFPKVCILGAAGGGRDTWKRKKMAKLAENHCRKIFLTDEDPYDENPKQIVEQMAKAISIPKYEIIMDRRKAIRAALKEANKDDVVLLTGKGTDPYIMRANGEKEPWDESQIAREELKDIRHKGTKNEKTLSADQN
jgi:UDP-N-acetylmuramoyl-L-alanyl-D-glutamate--2,6-diaminopimelate ligase